MYQDLNRRLLAYPLTIYEIHSQTKINDPLIIAFVEIKRYIRRESTLAISLKVRVQFQWT
jgi:hypothetical protein